MDDLLEFRLENLPRLLLMNGKEFRLFLNYYDFQYPYCDYSYEFWSIGFADKSPEVVNSVPWVYKHGNFLPIVLSGIESAVISSKRKEGIEFIFPPSPFLLRETSLTLEELFFPFKNCGKELLITTEGNNLWKFNFMGEDFKGPRLKELLEAAVWKL